jgi:hypothetical protein
VGDEVTTVTEARDRGPYRLAIRDLVRRVNGDPDRLRLMVDEWRAALSTVEFDVRRNDLLADPNVVRSHEYRDFLDVLKELLLASVGETINRLADEELQRYRRQT